VEYELIKQSDESRPKPAFYILRAKNIVLPLAAGLQGTLVISDGSSDSNILCIFKTEMDAEEFITNTGGLDSFEAYGPPNRGRALGLLKNASEHCTHVAVNPPLRENKPCEPIPIYAAMHCMLNGGDIRDVHDTAL
jgi:hypothetical protein